MKLLGSILSEGDDVTRGSWSNLYTLAQLARRAGISEGRARALHADKKLPRPDRKDADGRPLWLGSTIDAWCRQTGRPLREAQSLTNSAARWAILSVCARSGVIWKAITLSR